MSDRTSRILLWTARGISLFLAVLILFGLGYFIHEWYFGDSFEYQVMHDHRSKSDLFLVIIVRLMLPLILLGLAGWRRHLAFGIAILILSIYFFTRLITSSSYSDSSNDYLWILPLTLYLLFFTSGILYTAVGFRERRVRDIRHPVADGRQHTFTGGI